MKLTPVFVFLLLASNVAAQSQSSGPVPSGPAYAIATHEERLPVAHYRRDAPLEVSLSGTWLLPKAHGEVKVSSALDGLRIEAHVAGLAPASDLGPAYLTYVLWATARDGRFRNLGELVLEGSNGAVAATTDLSSFALFITAEPYYAVTEPSEAIILRNVVPNAQLRYKIAPDLLPLLRDRQTPLDLLQARNAVRIARRTGAERLASDALQKAVHLLSEAEKQYRLDDRWQTILKARGAIEAAEAARVLAARAEAEKSVSEQMAEGPHD